MVRLGSNCTIAVKEIRSHSLQSIVVGMERCAPREMDRSLTVTVFHSPGTVVVKYCTRTELTRRAPGEALKESLGIVSGDDHIHCFGIAAAMTRRKVVEWNHYEGTAHDLAGTESFGSPDKDFAALVAQHSLLAERN